MSTLIIQNPHNQGTLCKYTQNSMTIALWILWIYLLLPILEPLLILIGNDIQVINQIERSLNIKQFIAIFPFIIMIIPGYWLWSKYNTLLYHRHNKKKSGNIVHHHESSNYFGISSQKLHHWQQLKQVTVRLTEQGNISCIKEHKSLKEPC